MSNSYFQFKQFRIEQADCAMKVTTEGCILGACACYPKPVRILDIGSGTGVLSLMLAQQYDCTIDAVEIDTATAKQALNNFTNSKWDERLNLYHQDIEDFTSASGHKYDLIVSNPPFFNSSLKSTDHSKNLAIHDQNLPQQMLLKSIAALISDRGRAFVIYPEYEANRFLNFAMDYGLVGQSGLIMRNKPGGKVFRQVVEISKLESSQNRISKELCIRNEHNEFSKEYVELLKPYYLHL